MLKPIKLATLAALRGSGVFRLVANSNWRQQRLLILCYHGTSLEDEHRWRPSLYIHPQRLEARLELLKKGRYSVLPLAEALRRLHAGTLPPRSVALTFDDGTYDFFKQAYPLLQAYGFPVTVYQTTYYVSLQRPVFHLICSYMLWKRRNEVIADAPQLGIHKPMDLRTEIGRRAVVLDLIAFSEQGNKTGLEKDEIAGRLALLLRIDYDQLKAKRILHMMSSAEVQEIARRGVDVQLHTHRHRTPEDEILFRKEIDDNRDSLRALAANDPVHFCYPSGVYRPSFLPWLSEERVVSATTCDSGFATRKTPTLLLPRYIDNQNRTELEFESWLTGVGDILAIRRAATQRYIPGRS